jgi:hypothetical protein
MLKKSEGEISKRKISKKHQEEIRVGGAKDGSISNMNIGEKLKILVDITKLNNVKDVFKNSPFDKKTDGTYYDSDKITLYNVGNNVLQTIKFILMCIYLGTDESYYYLVNHFNNIYTEYNIDLKVFPNKELYKTDKTDNKHYTEHKNYADTLFNNLELKLKTYNTDGKSVVINDKLSNFDYFIYEFIENFYKFRIYCQTDDSGSINKLYVPFKYYNLTKLKKKDSLITIYKDSNGNSLNNNFRIVEKNADIQTIIEDIKKYTTEFDNIIVIEQKKGKKELKYPEKFTATMIIDFLNSLYTTPIINDEYDKYIKGKILEYNTYFFVELFIKEKKNTDEQSETLGMDDSTLTKLLKYLRRAAIGNYRDKEEFMKIVENAICNIYSVSVPLQDNNMKLYNKIEANVEIIIIGRDLLCDDADNILGIQSIIFYSFMIHNENFYKDDIIIDRLKSISKIEESTVRISQKKSIKDCDKIIDNIVSNKKFLLGFSLYTTYSTEILKKEEYNAKYEIFKNIAKKIKENLNPNYENIIKNYNKSIDLYFAKYKIIDTDVAITEIKKKELKYIFDNMGL